MPSRPPTALQAETDPRIIALFPKFAEGQCRVTRQRVQLLRAILSLELPATIRDIRKLAGTKACDVVTANRSLRAMERVGILRSVFAGTRGIRFFFATTPEPLFVFSEGGRVAERIDLPHSLEIDAALRRVEESLGKLGYTDVSHVIQFFGSRGPEEPILAELTPRIPERAKPVTKRRKPAKPTKSDSARERIDAYLRQRFEVTS